MLMTLQYFSTMTSQSWIKFHLRHSKTKMWFVFEPASVPPALEGQQPLAGPFFVSFRTKIF